jgi:hypothetical protein
MLTLLSCGRLGGVGGSGKMSSLCCLDGWGRKRNAAGAPWSGLVSEEIAKLGSAREKAIFTPHNRTY